MSKKFIVVEKHISVLDPDEPMLGPLQSGSLIVARTAPGCWGPMITPELIGGHEVTQPVAIHGAEVGDSIAIKLRSIRILSSAATSGVDRPIKGRYTTDAAIAARCPGCGILNPKTYLKGVGPDAVRCSECDSVCTPFEMASGYTIVFDDERRLGVTVTPDVAAEVAEQSAQALALPRGAKQHPSTVLGSADIVGVISRMRPFVGNIGTIPAGRIPAVKNSRDSALRTVGADHAYGLTHELAENVSDGHLDSDQVRAGSTLIVPVKVPGAGVYFGDVHATQGDGEIAIHTIDVTGEIIAEVHLLKKTNLDFPVLLPLEEDLPAIAKPFSQAELSIAKDTASKLGFQAETDVLPIQVIGTGLGVNEALENALQRMSTLTGMAYNEVRNRTTIAGSVDIARMSGVVQLTMLVPTEILDKRGIGDLVREAYCQEDR